MPYADPYVYDVLCQIRATDGGFVDDALSIPLYAQETASVPQAFGTSTSIKKFGAASIAVQKLLNDGSQYNVVQLPVSSTSPFSYTGNFTIDFWYYRLSSATDQGQNSDYAYMGGQNVHAMIYADGKVRLRNDFSNFDQTSAAGVVPADQWTFISIQRIGSTIYLHVNGTVALTATYASTLTCNSGAVTIYASTYPLRSVLYGYFDEFRITNSVARYGSGTYTPPTSGLESFKPATPFPSATAGSDPHAANVVMQIRGESASLVNDVGNVALTLAGGTTSVSSGHLGGAGSAYFPNSSSTATFASNPPNLNTIGTGAFTMEYWCNPALDKNFRLEGTGTGTASWAINNVGNQAIQIYDTLVAGGYTPTLPRLRSGTWNLVTLTRQADSTYYVHINGVMVQTGTSTVNLTRTNIQFASPSGGPVYWDDFRITVGVARYSSANYEIPAYGMPPIPVIFSGGVTWASAMSLFGGMYPACAGAVSFSTMTIAAVMRADSYGQVVFAPIRINGVSVLGAGALGEIEFPSLTLNGFGCLEFSGASFTTPYALGSGVIGGMSTCEVRFSSPDVSATGYITRTADGAVVFVLPAAEAEAKLGVVGGVDIEFHLLTLDADGLAGRAGAGDAEYAPLVVNGRAGVGVVSNGRVSMPALAARARAA